MISSASSFRKPKSSFKPTVVGHQKFSCLFTFDVQMVCLLFRRDKILMDLRKEGVNCGGCGPAAIRLRPALIFQPKHADIFIAKMDKVLGSY